MKNDKIIPIFQIGYGNNVKKLKSTAGILKPIYKLPKNQKGEEFKFVVSEDINIEMDRYMISNYGRIWDTYSEEFVSYGESGGRYVASLLTYKNFYKIYQLVFLLTILI